jgi:hypothetical protein
LVFSNQSVTEATEKKRKKKEKEKEAKIKRVR